MLKRTSKLSLALLTILLTSATLMFRATAADPVPPKTAKEVVCGDCHTCTTPSKGDPCLSNCPRPRSTKDADESPAYVQLDELEYEYYEVVFNHRLHAEMSAMSGECGDCHHFTAGRPIGACKGCHPAGEVKDMKVPSLKAAYHRQCMNCHSAWSGVTSCEMCHVKKVTPAPASEPTRMATTPSRRFFPEMNQPEKKIWNSTYDGGTIVTFFHRNHSELYGIDCATCHHAEGCGSCHRKGTTTQQVRHSEEALHAICNSCHAEMSCQQCHAKTEAQPFSHDRTGWKLGKYHGKAACRSCHGDPHHFERPSRVCNDCHAHWTPATFEHARTGLELSENHRENDCASCHAQRLFDATPTCAACHDSDVSFPAKQPGQYVGAR
jgi:hypothetical protein